MNIDVINRIQRNELHICETAGILQERGNLVFNEVESLLRPVLSAHFSNSH